MSTTTLLRRTLTLTTTLRRFSTKPTPRPGPIPIRTKTLTPLQTQFETWTTHLKPGFTPADVNLALKAQTDHDLAYDLFRWTSQNRGYSHDQTTYLTMIQLSLSSNRTRIAVTLIEEILAGTVPPSLPLFNTLIRHCSRYSGFTNRAFDVYKRMLLFTDKFKPDLDTYSMLFEILLRKFSRIDVCYIHLNSVKSLTKQMILFGVIPDVFVLNMIIKAYVKCRVVSEAVRVFREIGLYGGVPDRHSYSFVITGLCETGRVLEGLKWFREMSEKGLVATNTTLIMLICSLSLERMFDEAVEILRGMFENGVRPDLLTYRTLLDEMSRDGKGNEAIELLEEIRAKDSKMDAKGYKALFDSVHFSN